MRISDRFGGEVFWLVVVFGFVAVVAAAAPATNPSSGAWSPVPTYERLRASGSPTRFEGNVLSLDDLAPSEGSESGVQLRVRSDAGDVVVDLGPRWFVLQNDFTITRGEPISVVGVAIRLEGKSTVVADSVKTKDRLLILRDEAGRPRWERSEGRPRDK